MVKRKRYSYCVTELEVKPEMSPGFIKELDCYMAAEAEAPRSSV